MEHFLESVERQAYRLASLATGNREDALDAVQDAMLRFVTKYRAKPPAQWKPLFYRVLYSQIATQRRKRSLRNRWFLWHKDHTDLDLLENEPDRRQIPAARRLQIAGAFSALEKALADLSLRQQQAFLLRAWEDLSVSETAAVMNCSESSVKTHYARAVAILQEQLGEHWP